MSIFYCYAAATAVCPRKAMQRLAGEAHPARAAAGAVGFVGVLYAGASIALAACGAVPLTSVVLDIAPENYYVWQAIFALPFAFLAWAAAACLVLLIVKKEKGRKAFQTFAGLAGIAAAATLLVAWIPMAVETFFVVAGMRQQEFVDILSAPGFWQCLYISCYILAAAAAVVLLTLAAASGQFKKGRRFRSLVAGVFAAAVLAGGFALVIR